MLRVFLYLLTALFWRQGLTESGAYQLLRSSWPVSRSNPPASASLAPRSQAHTAMSRFLFRCWESEVSSILLEWQVLYRLNHLLSPRNNILVFFFSAQNLSSQYGNEHTRKNITLLWEEIFEEVVSICPASVCILVMLGVSSWVGQVRPVLCQLSGALLTYLERKPLSMQVLTLVDNRFVRHGVVN